jgi:hypothetical protein
MLVGSWQNSRGSFSNFLNIVSLLTQTKVSLDDKGRPVVPIMMGLNGAPYQFVEVEPFLWKDLNGHERLAAEVVDGKIVRFSLDALPFMMFDPVPWYKNGALVTPLLIASAVVLLLTVLLWPTRALVRRRFGAALALDAPGLRAYRLSRLAALAILLVLVGWAVAIMMLVSDISYMVPGFDPVIWILQVASFIVFLGGLAVLLWSARVAWRKGQRWTGKVWSLLLVLSALVIIWVGFAFHLLDFGAQY